VRHAADRVQVLMDFPQLTMTLPDGREESIMKRTTLVRAQCGHDNKLAQTGTCIVCKQLGATMSTY
jgi:hypothetical protein